MLLPVTIRLFTPADLEGCLRCFKSNVPLYFTAEETALFRHFLEIRVPQNPATLPYYVLISGKEPIGCGGWDSMKTTRFR